MKIKGEDLDAGFIDWAKSEIKEAPKQIYDLGKFFFTVSIGTIGAIAALEKLNQSSAMDAPMIISMVILFGSILVALDLARPRRIVINGATELQQAYSEQIHSALTNVNIWLALWFVGTIFGGYAVRS